MPDVDKFVKALRANKVDGQTIAQILEVPYPPADDPGQENANYYAEAMRLCDELLGFDTAAEVGLGRACCKSGYRLENAKQMAKEHGDEPMEEKLRILGTLKYMGSPRLNADGDIEAGAVGTHGAPGLSCPCWRLKGHLPAQGPMPLSYCLCCAGHFRFHYEKALGTPLRVKSVVSSIVNSEGKEPCVFVFEIMGKGK